MTLTRLLTGDAPAPFILHPATTDVPFIFVCDHAGRRIPKRLGDLGVSAADRTRHIAWDIGIAEVARRLHEALGATLIEQVYSRLVIDCNRAPGHATSIPHESDHTIISGNHNLSDDERRQREGEIFRPYHDCIAQQLATINPQKCAVISLHSFTPVWQGQSRAWDAGVLFHKDAASADIMHQLLVERGGWVVGKNEPYRMTATSDYTIPYHAETRGMPYLEIEIRQDLIADEAGQENWAAILTQLLPKYWRRWTACAPAQRAYV